MPISPKKAMLSTAAKCLDFESIMLRPVSNDRKSRRKKQCFDIFNDDTKDGCALVSRSWELGLNLTDEVQTGEQLCHAAVPQRSTAVIPYKANMKKRRAPLIRSGNSDGDAVHQLHDSPISKALLLGSVHSLQAPAFVVDRAGRGDGKENVPPGHLLADDKGYPLVVVVPVCNVRDRPARGADTHEDYGVAKRNELRTKGAQHVVGSPSKGTFSYRSRSKTGACTQILSRELKTDIPLCTDLVQVKSQRRPQTDGTKAQTFHRKTNTVILRQ